MAENEFELKIHETIKDMDFDRTSMDGSLIASSIINEAYLKTILSLGIEILSKMDTSKTRKELGEHYVNMFKNQLTDTLALKGAKKNN
ncbi:MAG: hypothetical protein JWO32_2046 [Bacteroidetes bacterium]|nr:hypothetical protein [Bacteroidota bacterium]